MSPFRQRLILYPLIVVAFIYAFLIFLALRSDSMIFQPQGVSYTDQSIVAPYQLHKIHSGESTLTAVYLPNPSARFTLLMSHGNAEDTRARLPFTS